MSTDEVAGRPRLNRPQSSRRLATTSQVTYHSVSQAQGEAGDEEDGEEESGGGGGAAVPPLRRPGTRRALLHCLEQAVHQVRGGGVGALHEAGLHALHDRVSFPDHRMSSRCWKRLLLVPAILLLKHIEMHLVIVEVVVGVEDLRDGLVDAG